MAAALVGIVFAIAGASFASGTAVAVADVDTPTGSVTLAPGASGNINIQITVTGAQDGNATFQVNRNWSLSGGAWTGSNPQTFNVPGPRTSGAGGTPPLVLNTTGTVSVAAGQADGTFPLSVQVFGITNSNTTGAKLGAGSAGSYSVTVATPAPSDTQAPQGVSVSINSGAAWTTDAGGDVTLAFSATDNVGVASYKLATSQAGLASASSHAVSPAEASFSRNSVAFALSSGEDAAKEVWFEACDAAGNCTADKDTIGWDKTAPAISYVSRTAANGYGWNSGNVTVNWSCTDSLSGPVNAAVSDTVSGEGANQSSTGTCYDQAGNSASDTQSGINIDKTAPSIGYVSRTPANGAGWNSDDVTVTWSCADGLSGAVDSPISNTVSGEGANQSSTGTCYDKAGNSASDTQSGINIDKTAPTITLVSRTPANGAGWNNGDVTLTWSCVDPLSGPVAASVSDTVSGEGANQSSTGTCYDQAGNTASDTQSGINIDKTAPSISYVSRTAANANGWNSGDVTVNWSCADGLSGAVASAISNTVSSEGVDQSSTGTCYDKAGNSANDTQSGINIDKTAPSISYVSRTAANANGWNSGDVTVNWSCTDSLSGPVDASLSNTVATEGANQSSTGTCHDLAGNSASDTQSGINIDKTAPTITLVSRTPANGAGWNNGDVTLTWSCVDPLSGPVAASVSDTLTTEGVGQSSTGTCHDYAGNSASNTQTGIQIDKTAPGLTWNGGPANGASYYFGSVPSAPTCSASDALSGPNGCVVTGYSSAVGPHTLTAKAHDVAGNETVETRTYTVLAWTLSGFYQPVDMGGVWNTVKNGSTVPLKFEVFSGATELTDTAVVNQPLKATQTPCSGGTIDDVELLSSGSTALRYDATAGQFIYNWQTPKKVGYCYVVTVTTADGSSISANFKLK